jgi:hypothetical protein
MHTIFMVFLQSNWKCLREKSNNCWYAIVNLYVNNSFEVFIKKIYAKISFELNYNQTNLHQMNVK